MINGAGVPSGLSMVLRIFRIFPITSMLRETINIY